MVTAAAFEDCRCADRERHVQRCSNSTILMESAAGVVEAAAATRAAATLTAIAGAARATAAAHREAAATRRGAATEKAPTAVAAETAAEAAAAETAAAPVLGVTEAVAAGTLNSTGAAAAAAAALERSARRETECLGVEEKDARIACREAQQHLYEKCLFRHNTSYQTIRRRRTYSVAGWPRSLSSAAREAQRTAATIILPAAAAPSSHDDSSSPPSLSASASATLSLSSGCASGSAVARCFHWSLSFASAAASLADAGCHTSGTAHALSPCRIVPATAVPAAAAASSPSSRISSFSMLSQYSSSLAAVVLRLLSSHLAGSLRTLNEALRRTTSKAAAAGGRTASSVDDLLMRDAMSIVKATSGAAASPAAADQASSSFRRIIAAAQCEERCAAAAAGVGPPGGISGVASRLLGSSQASLSIRKEDIAAEEYASARDSCHSRWTLSRRNVEGENSSNTVTEDRSCRCERSSNQSTLNSSSERTACCRSSGALMGRSHINSKSLQHTSSSSSRTCRCRNSSSSSNRNTNNGATDCRQRNTAVAHTNGKKLNLNRSSSSSKSRSSSHGSSSHSHSSSSSNNRSQSSRRTQNSSRTLNSSRTWVCSRGCSRSRVQRNSSSKRIQEESGSQYISALEPRVSIMFERYNSNSSWVSAAVPTDAASNTKQRHASCSTIMDCRGTLKEELSLPVAAPTTGEASVLGIGLSTAVAPSRMLLLSSPLTLAAGRRKASSRYACSRSLSLLQHLLLLFLLLWKCEAESTWVSSPDNSSHSSSAYSTNNRSAYTINRPAHTNPTTTSRSPPRLFPAAVAPIHTSVFPAATVTAVDCHLPCCDRVSLEPETATTWGRAATAGEGAAESLGKVKTLRRSKTPLRLESSCSFLTTLRQPHYNSKRWRIPAYVDGLPMSAVTAHGGNSSSAAAAARAGPRYYVPAAVSAAVRHVSRSSSSPTHKQQQQQQFAAPSNGWLLLPPLSDDSHLQKSPHTLSVVSVGWNDSNKSRSASSSSSSSACSIGLGNSSSLFSDGYHSGGNSSNTRQNSSSKLSRSSTASWSSSRSSNDKGSSPSLKCVKIGGSSSSSRSTDTRSSSRIQSTQGCSEGEKKSENVDKEAEILSPVDLFEMLGVARDASAAEIEKGYQQARSQVAAAAGGGGCPALAEMVEAAHAVLRDETLKEKYEATGCIPKRIHSSFQAVEAMGRPGEAASPSEGAAAATAAGAESQTAAESDGDAAEDDDENAEAATTGDDAEETASKPLGLGGVFSSLFTRGLGASSSSSKRQQPGEDVWTDVQLLLSEIACHGVEKDIKISVMRRCNSCRGTGAAGAANPIPCDACNGRGAITQVKRLQMGIMQSSRTCGSCGGSGIQPREVCSHCNGEGRKRVEETLQVSIPAGVVDGTTLTLRGHGDVGVAGGPPGDLLLNVEVTNDTSFRREGNNLLSIAKISYSDAVLGLPQVCCWGMKTPEIRFLQHSETIAFSLKEVEVIDGTAQVSIQPGTHSGDKIVIEGRGTVDATAVAEQEEVEEKTPPPKRGDHIVVVEIEVPDIVSADERRLLERLRELRPAKKTSHHQVGEARRRHQ